MAILLLETFITCTVWVFLRILNLAYELLPLSRKNCRSSFHPLSHKNYRFRPWSHLDKDPSLMLLFLPFVRITWSILTRRCSGGSPSGLTDAEVERPEAEANSAAPPEQTSVEAHPERPHSLPSSSSTALLRSGRGHG